MLQHPAILLFFFNRHVPLPHNHRHLISPQAIYFLFHYAFVYT